MEGTRNKLTLSPFGSSGLLQMSFLKCVSDFYFNQAHDKLEEGRKQVETQDSVKLAKEVRLHFWVK